MSDCTYSIPAVRNVNWFKTETGFVTAGHCFETQNGNDVWQPDYGDSKIGDLTKHKHSGECDCAFVKKTGSESTTLGMFSDISTLSYSVEQIMVKELELKVQLYNLFASI